MNDMPSVPLTRRYGRGVDDDLAVLVGRDGWTVDRGVATYRHPDGGWSARVRSVRAPGRSYEQFHVALIDPGGMARFAQFASTVGEAYRLAEGQVRGKLT